jgi:hypothetical protein
LKKTVRPFTQRKERDRERERKKERKKEREGCYLYLSTFSKYFFFDNCKLNRVKNEAKVAFPFYFLFSQLHTDLIAAVGNQHARVDA